MVLENPLARNLRLSKRKLWTPARVSAAAKSESLQLLILTQFFPPDFAATGQLIDELAVQLGRQGVDVNVFTGQPGYAFAKDSAPDLERKENVWVKRSRVSQMFKNRIRGKAINGLLYTVRAIAHLARNSNRYHVMLVTTAPPFLSVIAYFANIFFKLPYVCLLYDLYPDIAVELGVVKSSHPIAKAWRSLNLQIWKRSASIIVLSNSMQERIVGYCPEVADKVHVIHSWSDDKQIAPIDKQENWFAKEHDLLEHFVVLYSGNMGRCHDIDTLFEAACHLKAEPILFVCIGGGAKREKLMKDVEARGLKNFRFLPYQEKSVLPYSLTASDLSLVSVASGMESLVAPSKLYPAMAAGRPIAAICSPQSYLGPLLKSAECGDSFNNGEAKQLADYIQSLAKDKVLSKQLGHSGRCYLETHFTPEIISRQYLDVMKSAAEK
ncbi:MAG: glycosyltransferase family 4 protein [Cyanobacteria bacterium J06621_11]